MFHSITTVSSITPVGPDIYVMGFHAPDLAPLVLPGQFVNIKVHEFYQPLLRRPFSVYRVEGGRIFILFNIIGAGTRILFGKKIGDAVDMIGPLGHPYDLEGELETAILVGGGMGVAPFPLFTERNAGRKKIATFIGARTRSQIVRDHLESVHIATDDGSEGFHGTVVELLRSELRAGRYTKPKIFGCGPNPMLRSLAMFAAEMDIPCEVSLESAMACGIGLCQGCPVERVDGTGKYALICKDGPVFDAQGVRLP